MQTLKIFLSVLVLGPVLDFFWFSLIASDLYKKEIGSILRLKPDFAPAVLVYILIALLITFFVLPKAGSIGTAFLWGALAGLVLYGVYDFSNMTFLKDWNWTISIIDVLWGTFMVGGVSAVAYYIKSLI